ncbi:MAG: L-histidine N(alpha)-methyltransferase [Acidobacteria bacterium]|nr:MAG: L-histidine N(alpha)-methyltransferase [Acidobacteriota bacterium]
MLERAAPRERFTFRQIAMRRSFADDVRDGLEKSPKELQPWYFYDAIGSALFTAITELPEYTITRAETEILRRNSAAIARALRSPERVIELGSGDGRKTGMLLDALIARQPRITFVPIDVDGGVLESTARDFLARFPTLRVDAVCGDYREVSSVITPGLPTVVLFLGSSIGNSDPEAAVAMLRDIRRVLGQGDSLFLGADLQKPKEIVEAAYNDSLGVTAAFNLNLLARINRELGGQFDLSKFAHRAFLNEQKSRIEMHLVSRERQSAAIDDLRVQVHLERSETIHTENSYKYAESDLEMLARESGFAIEESWVDSTSRFADVLMVAR